MYYLPFDRLMGLWIINEFLNNDEKLPDQVAGSRIIALTVT